MKLTRHIIKAFADDKTPKFLSTVDENGIPNIVPVISLEVYDNETIIFAEFMLWKSRKNLEKCPKVTVAVLTKKLEVYVIKGQFIRFENKGTFFEYLSKKDMFRYNAYSGIRNAGVIKVEEVLLSEKIFLPTFFQEIAVTKLVEKVFNLSRQNTVRKGTKAQRHRGTEELANGEWRMANGNSNNRCTDAQLRVSTNNRDNSAVCSPQSQSANTVKAHPLIKEKFNEIKAAKFIAYTGQDGYPIALPALSLFFANDSTLVFSIGYNLHNATCRRLLKSIKQPAPIAACVITSAPVAYQVKGTFKPYSRFFGTKTWVINLLEVYSASPPLAGKRLAPRE